MMVEVRLETPEFNDYFDMADKYRMVPDYWRTFPEVAELEFRGRVFWTLYDDEVLAGYLWLESYIKDIPELGCTLGAVVVDEDLGNWPEEAMPAIQEILKLCFDPEGFAVPRVTVILDRRRSHAERFFKDLGFEYEGRLPKAQKVKGQWITLNHLGMTDDRFRAIEEKNHVGYTSKTCRSGSDISPGRPDGEERSAAI